MGAGHAPRVFVGLFIAVLLAVPVLGNRYHLTVMIFAGIFAIAAIGLNLLIGYTGQVSFGHNAFVGIGAYTSAILTTTYGATPIIALGVSLVVAGFVAVLVGYPTLSLRGHYLAMGTAALGLIAYVVFAEAETITQGFMGITSIPRLRVGPFMLDTEVPFFYATWTLVLFLVAASSWLIRSHVGLVLRAIRGNESATRMLGVPTPRYKLAMFFLSACCAALAGSLFAHWVTFVSPEPFPLGLSIELVVMLFVGGVGTVWGPVAGAVVLTVVPEALRQYKDYSHLLYGAVLIFMLLFAPRGLVGELGARWNRLAGRTRVPGPLPDESGLPDVLVSPTRGANLKVNGLVKRFGGLVAVDSVGFSVRAGEIAGLIGPNGAGKTTVFNVLTGAFRSDAGEVFVDGRSILGLSPNLVAMRGIARSYQKVKLFPGMTVLEHGMVGCYPWVHESARAAALLGFRSRMRVRAEAWRVLKLTGLTAHAHEEATALPFGKQRLLEIARALAGRPRLLLLDEPAAGLNTAETRELVGLLRRIRGDGVTIVVIEHDMSLVMTVCDHLVVLNFGRKIAEGPPALVRNDEDVRHAYLGSGSPAV